MHEAWLRLDAWKKGRSNDAQLDPHDEHLLASHIMRRVLTDHARRRTTAKRDVRRHEAGIDPDQLAPSGSAFVLEVDDALRDLAELDAELAEVVELRFFGGHSLQEVADLRGLSLRTMNRRWKLARAFLLTAFDDPVGSTA